jgi:hypothetical protein
MNKIKIYLDLNILLGKKEFPEGSIVPLLLVFELFTSDTIDIVNTKKCYDRIKNMCIDPRFPVKKGKEAKDAYDFTPVKNDIYRFSFEEFEKRENVLFIWFKGLEMSFSRGFIMNKFLDDGKDKIIFNKCFRNNDDNMLDIVNGIKERFSKEIPYSKEASTVFNTDIFDKVLAYYHYNGVKKGTPGRNDFTDLQYLLYLNNDSKLYTKDAKLKEALNRFSPNNLYSE